MALTLPLQIWEQVYSHCYHGKTNAQKAEERLAEIIVKNANLLDLIKWRRVSRAFKEAVTKRLSGFKRVDVRVYPGLNKMYLDRERDSIAWHPHAPILMMEMSPDQIGVAIDSNMKTVDIRALLEILSIFRASTEELFMDCPVIDLFMAQISKEQMNALLNLLRKNRKVRRNSGILESMCKALDLNKKSPIVTPGPFFANLKKFTVTSTSTQLEHLSRLSTYTAGVDMLYHSENLDILCLRIILGGKWCHKPHFRMFKHVARFRQWTDADSLGERYFQQFSGNSGKTKY